MSTCMSLCGVRIGKGLAQTVQKQTKTCLLQTLRGQEIQNKVHHKKAWFVLEDTWLFPNLYRGGKNA